MYGAAMRSCPTGSEHTYGIEKNKNKFRLFCCDPKKYFFDEGGTSRLIAASPLRRTPKAAEHMIKDTQKYF
jgi:hypothetical protein